MPGNSQIDWRGGLLPYGGSELVKRPDSDPRLQAKQLGFIRANEGCRQLGIKGVTLHSYRYAWAERAKVAGMPERFAQEALGHNSKAVHRAYAKRALMKIPSLEDYEERAEPKTTPTV